MIFRATGIHGNKVIVNSDCIACVIQAEAANRRKIIFAGDIGCLEVTETLDEIELMMRGVEARLSRVEETPTVEANSPEALLNWLRESLPLLELWIRQNDPVVPRSEVIDEDEEV